MVNAALSPIAGVSPGRELTLEETWPSVASTSVGRLLGRICDCIPVRINGVKISHLLFGLPAGGLGAVVYLWLKFFGKKYRLTNQSVQIVSSLGQRMFQKVSLTEIADIAIVTRPGQEFHRSGDLQLLNERGDVLMVLHGVVRPLRFRQIILETRAARLRSDAALSTIMARRG